MIKTLAKQIKEFKAASIATPLFMILEVLMEMIIPFLMASIIDKGVNAGDIQHIYKVGGIMVVAAAIGLFAGMMGGRYGAKASAGFARNLREAMFNNIQTFSFANIDKFSTAGLVTRMTTDVTNIQNAYQMILRMFTRAPASMICAMVMAFTINARLACIYLVAVIILGILLFLIMSHATKYFQQAFPKYDDLNESVQENVSAIRVVKAYVREEQETSKLRRASENIYNIFVKAETNLVFNAPMMQTTVYTCILLVSWFGAKMIASNSLTTGELMSLLTYCMNILMSLMMLSMVFVMITMSMASAKRISEVLNETSDLKNPEHPFMKVEDGSIEFRHVDFAYKKDSDEPVLEDIDLKIRSGETIGIIGGTGSGKSTLVSLIPRFYDPQEGTVKVNGINAKDYPQGELCSEIGVVQQRSILFKGSIRDNLKWGNDQASDEDLWKAITIAQAKDIVEAKLGKLDSEVEQNGRNLSGGQKQRLTIARALVSKPEILILDDSLSALDFATDAALRKAIGELEGNVTTFLVSQRISGIRQADKILVMEDGELAGQGTHEELMETCETYQEIYYSQFPEERPAAVKSSKETGKDLDKADKMTEKAEKGAAE